MFKSNDKSFYMIRKFINVVFFVLMCIAFLSGIIMMASSFYLVNRYNASYIDCDIGMLFAGIGTMLLGPVVLQFFWLITDVCFNIVFDVKIIRNAVCRAEIPTLPKLLFNKKKRNNENYVDAYEKLKMYKELCEEGVLSETEYNDIKKDLLNKNIGENNTFVSEIGRAHV